jgi:hypothetical protein
MANVCAVYQLQHFNSKYLFQKLQYCLDLEGTISISNTHPRQGQNIVAKRKGHV